MSEARGLDRRILALAIPAAGSAMLQVVHRAVDMHFVSELGTDALAGLSVSIIAVWMYGALGALVGMGITALVARYVGAGRADAARYVAAQGVGWAAAIGVVAGAVGILLTPLVFQATGATQGVTEAGIGYTRVYWAGGGIVLVHLACDAVFRGQGNTRVPFVAAALALALNVALDPLLIYGWGPVPALGVAGAAWATLLATSFAVALLLWALVRRGHVARARPTDERMLLAPPAARERAPHPPPPVTPLGRPGLLGLDRAVLRRIGRVGLPVAAAGFFFNAIYLGIHRIVAEAGGPAAQAGLGLGHTGEGVAFVLCLGWAAAASALVGRELGAGRPDHAAWAAWRAAAQCAALCAIWGGVLFFFGEEVVDLLTRQGSAAEGAARAHALSYFRIVAFCLALQAVELVIDGAFGGAGLTVPPMVIGMSFSLARIPLALWAAFGLGLGVDGIWWTIAITAALRGIAAGLWFARGTWKTRAV